MVTKETAMAHCSKCGYNRPVGVRCHRNMHSSAPTLESARDFTMQKSVEDLQAATMSGFQLLHTPVSEGAMANMSHGTLESKPDILLKKMENIEKEKR